MHFDLPQKLPCAFQLRTVPMKVYGIRFLTHGGDVFAVEWVQVENDEAAKKHALRLRTRFGKGHEIWEGNRLVEKFDY
jgi:hypothetical protein